MSSIIYDKYFGKEYSYSLFKTQEKKSNNIYIYYYQNSISSFAYLFSSFYIYFNRKNYSLSCSVIEILLFLLSFVSFFWWASQRLFIHKIDILLYSSFLLIPGLYNLSNNSYITDAIFVILLCLFNFFNYLLILNNKYSIIKKINGLSVLFSLYLLYEIRNIIFYDTCLFIISFIYKLGDTYKFIKYTNISGTAIFHLISAFVYGTLISNINNYDKFPNSFSNVCNLSLCEVIFSTNLSISSRCCGCSPIPTELLK